MKIYQKTKVKVIWGNCVCFEVVEAAAALGAAVAAVAVAVAVEALAETAAVVRAEIRISEFHLRSR